MTPEQITILTNGGVAALAIYLLFQERKERLNLAIQLEQVHAKLEEQQIRYRQEIISILTSFTGKKIEMSDIKENEDGINKT